MSERANVPCGACRACCRNNLVLILPDEGDDPALYEMDRYETPHGEVLVLKHRPNGDCVYLGADGCTIHDHAPAICRVFDCRGFFAMRSRNERRVLSRGSETTRAIFAAGRERLQANQEGRP